MTARNGSTNGTANGLTKHVKEAPADTYKLPRDANESQRLDAQHSVLRTNVGFLLHPRIIADIPKSGKVEIADIGTGTGAWLLDLAEELNNDRFIYTGLDMSALQFPPSPPPGMTFDTHNILSPVPSGLLARFDIIHVRFLVLGLPSGTWPQALSNLTSMLKPHGWLQWTEPDFRTIGPLALSEPSTLETLHLRASGKTTIHALIAHGVAHHNLAFRDSESLPSLFSTANLTDITSDAFASDRVPSTRLDLSRVFVRGITGMQKMVTAAEKGGNATWGDDGTGRKVLDAVGVACERGEMYWRVEVSVTTGRKSGD